MYVKCGVGSWDVANIVDSSWEWVVRVQERYNNHWELSARIFGGNTNMSRRWLSIEPLSNSHISPPTLTTEQNEWLYRRNIMVCGIIFLFPGFTFVFEPQNSYLLHFCIVIFQTGKIQPWHISASKAHWNVSDKKWINHNSCTHSVQFKPFLNI